jgi:anhydro-N-acetylmuramic acid kinase
MPRFVIGLMSGTSLDGIDAVVASFDEIPRLLHSYYLPFEAPLHDALLALQASDADEIHRAAIAAQQLAHAYAAAVRGMLAQAALQASDIEAIGCHGQTVRHRPDAGYSTQLVNAALLAELTQITVVSDFRSRDIAAGGQGAPLVPAFHRQLFYSANEHRVIVNIGGIANITDLPVAGPVTGFDCGPGNTLMDEWISMHLGHAYDRDGAWAATGNVVPNLYNKLFLNDFFKLLPPKSTGRDNFSLAWVKQALTGSERPQDVQATLLEISAQGIAQAVAKYCTNAAAVFVCGGGAHNGALMARIKALMPGRQLADTGALGLDPDWVEALAFAWLARLTLLRLPGNLPEVTGAKGPRILGAIYLA